MEPEMTCSKAPCNLGDTCLPGPLLPENILELQTPLAMADLAFGCRQFMELAYPGGPTTIPENRRPYFELAPDGAIGDCLPPAAIAVGICQDLSKLKGGLRGYEFRLGSADHPHLKLRVQLIAFHQRDVWVYSVDTHDRFAVQATKHLSAADQSRWRELVERNSQLKKEIEDALALAGHLTPRSLLRLDLTPAKP